LAIAGATAGTPASPMPVGGSSVEITADIERAERSPFRAVIADSVAHFAAAAEDDVLFDLGEPNRSDGKMRDNHIANVRTMRRPQDTNGRNRSGH
jgi:hypothetical protein